MKQLISPILVMCLAIGAACACSAHDGEATEPAAGDGTAGEGADGSRAPTDARDDRTYRGLLPKDFASVDWSCDAVEGATYPIVYVSPKGDDDAPGTANAPVFTLARAFRLAAQRGHSVYVCP